MTNPPSPSFPVATAKAAYAFNSLEEGKLSLRPSDPGNWFAGQLIGTMRGISAPTLAAWLKKNRPGGPALTAGYMAALPEDVYQSICRDEFWDKMGLSWIANVSPGLALSCYDHGFNRGPHWGPALVQAMIGMSADHQDGQFGPATLASYSNANQSFIAKCMLPSSTRYVQNIVDAVATGYWDDQTDQACSAMRAKNIVAIYALRDLQLHDYASIKPSNPVWSARANRRLAAAVALESIGP